MKLITLNSWGGRKKKEIGEFVERHQDTDIFCFQEMYHEAEGKETLFLDTTPDLLAYLKERMPAYNCLYHPHLSDWWGLAMFVKKDIEITDSGEVYVYKKKGWNYKLEVQGHTAKNIQYAILKTPLGERTIVNFHGLWNGQGKSDSEARLEQSKNITAFLKTLTNPHVLCGDFNLSPETVSIAMLEDAGMRNLIKEFGITSTRTSLYKKENRYADYIFVSGGVEVLDFSVLPDEVSDHNPLYLEFE